MIMISVVVPTRNSSKDLKECLDSLKGQSYKNFETVVVFDDSNDKNVDLAKNSGAKIVFDDNHTIGGAYFTGVNAAKGDILAFTDDDCIVPKDWLESIGNAFGEEVDIVSGEDLLPDNSSFFQKAAYQIDRARIAGKPLYGEKAKNRLRAANIAYRKSVFEKENFNPTLKGLQEPEFHHRLFKKGYRMKFDPELYVYHKRRSSLGGIFRQIYRNGVAKMALIRIHGDVISFIDVFPFLFILYTAFMAYMSASLGIVFFYAWLATIAGYFLLKPLVISAKSRGFRYYFHLVAIVAAREIAYALGIIYGTINAIGKKRIS
ncbi:glycosyltransferase [Candidatus Woesearchaeota archaeon]|nr:glycosyltransferase [Candidatus Woesearchaeota archaeon]